jgi:hypothetical protein
MWVSIWSISANVERVWFLVFSCWCHSRYSIPHFEKSRRDTWHAIGMSQESVWHTNSSLQCSRSAWRTVYAGRGKPSNFSHVAFEVFLSRDHSHSPEVVWRICLGLPVMMRRIGSSKRDYIRCWYDSAHMVLLRCLSRWCALCDLQILLEGSRSGLSRVFRFILTMVNRRFGKLVSNVKIWSVIYEIFSISQHS